MLMRKKRFFAVAVGRGPSKTFYVPCLTLLPPKSYSSLTQVLKNWGADSDELRLWYGENHPSPYSHY